MEIFRGMLQFFFGKAISEIALTTRKGSLFTWSGRESYNRAGGGGTGGGRRMNLIANFKHTESSQNKLVSEIDTSV